MKNLIRTAVVVLAALFLSAHAALADRIITRAAEIIECTVININDSKLQYRKNGESFEREIDRNDVFKIKYSNGTEEIFEKIAAPVIQPTTGEATSTEPAWSAFPPSMKRYNIGDWYSENGIEGIVIYTTPDGCHGRILHPLKFNASAYKPTAAFFTGPTGIALEMNDTSNGLANMQSLKRFMEAHPQYTADMFPIPAIIAGLGDGWYLPAINELRYLQTLRATDVVYSGVHKKFNGKRVKWSKILDYVSKLHNGAKHNDYSQLSSTEIFSQATGSPVSEALFGDPCIPQYCLLRMAADNNALATIRNKGMAPFYVFHLF